MKKPLRSGCSPWALLVFGALVSNLQAHNSTNTTTTTATSATAASTSATLIVNTGTEQPIATSAVSTNLATTAARTTTGPTTTVKAPGNVVNLNVSDITTSTMNVSWKDPDDSQYKLYWTDGESAFNKTVKENFTQITDLSPGVRYTITVTAVASDLREGEPANKTVYTKPDVVDNLTVVGRTTFSFYVNWTKPKGNTYFYRVQWQNKDKSDQINVSETFLNITNLTAGVQYTITVTAVAADNVTEGEKQSISQYTKPEAVDVLNVTGVTPTSVSLSWIVPEGERQFYTVTWNSETKTLSTNETQVNVTELNPGEVYCFNVTAVAGDNETKSDRQRICQSAKPDVVENLTVVGRTTFSFFVNWTKPKGTTAFYRIQWENKDKSDQINVSETFLNITNRTAGVQYTITVTAVAADNVTEGEKQSISQYTKPDIVQNLSVFNKSTSTIFVSWTKPNGNNSFYRVQWAGREQSDPITVSETFLNIHNLTPGVQYTIIVTAVAADNVTEGESRKVSTYTEPEVVRNLFVTEITSVSMSVNWTKPFGHSSFYKVQWTDWNMTLKSNETEPFKSLPNLIPGVEYEIRVTVVAGDNHTEGASVSMYSYTKPFKPVNVSVSSRSTDTLNINWILPLGRVDRYIVNIANVYLNYSNSIKTNISTATFSYLLPGRLYDVVVTAVAGDLNQTSDKFSFATNPMPVRSLILSNRTNSSLQLQWSTSPQMDGAPDISYFITYKRPTDSVQEKNTTYKSIVLEDLHSGTLYNISVTTAGPEQLKSTAVSNSTFTMPNPVQNAKAIPLSTTSIRVNWSEPLGVQNYYEYLVQCYNGTRALIHTNKINNKSYDIPNLDPGFVYSITIKTVVASDTESTPVELHSFTIPKAVTDLNVSSVTTTSIKLTWRRQIDYKSSYSYLVIALLNNIQVHSNSTQEEFITFNNLNPGSLYKFNVFTLYNGERSTSASIEEYTVPANVSDILAIGTTTNLSVSWKVADGQFSTYSVHLYSSVKNDTKNGPSNETSEVQFNNLKPGQLYYVVVVTKSGPKESSKASASNATFPTPPGSVMVDFQTNSSINFTWSLPAGMEPGPYNFSVSNKGGSVYTTNNWFLLENLEAGCSYNISVVTVGMLEYKSTPEMTQNYTKPNSVTYLRAAEITTTSVALEWNQPNSKPPYLYEVLVESVIPKLTFLVKITNGTTTINGLESGRNYTFTVTTLTADYTRAEPVKVVYYTKPYNITGLKALTLNTSAIYLNWTKPYEYKSDFNYWVETTGCNSQQIKRAEEHVTFLNLTSGTNCTFCVFVMAANDIKGIETCTNQYTKPEVVQPRISNEGSNNSVVVSWTKPTGNVEYYELWLNNSTTLLSFTNTSFKFTNLSAAVSYSAKLISCSGPFCEKSSLTTTATYPNPPGPIEILEKTTHSVELRWGEALLMHNASSYNYMLSYNSSKPNVHLPSVRTNYTLSQLVSGTSYNISVKTLGPMDFESEAVYKYSVTTRPHNVTSIRVIPTERTINLSWSKPVEYQDTYRFYVNWQSAHWNASRNTSNETANTAYNIFGLTPGTMYNISVTTKTADETESATETISICTNASPVGNLKCKGPNSGPANIILTWTQPEGINAGFQITVNDNPLEVRGSCCEHTISDLSHHSNYKVQVKTLSCGNSSSPVTLNTCQTGVSNPPIPLNFESKLVITPSRNGFSVGIPAGWIDDSKGPVTHVGILVTSDDYADNSSLASYLTYTYNDWKKNIHKAYLATITNNTLKSRSNSGNLEIEVGTGSDWEGYVNHPLELSGTYKYAIVVFTYLEVASGKITTGSSVYSISPFSSVIALPKDPANISIIIGVTLGIFGVLFVILLGFIIYWRRFSHKESPDIQIQSLGGKVSGAVRVEDFEAYYRKQKADSSCGFAEEFEDLKPVGTAQAKLHALALENKPKNRYNNVLPYDSSRVKLSVVHGNPNEDYINADYMPGYLSRKEYIAAQGPLPATVNDFWRMVWEKNVLTLVMLTRCNEQGRVKCEQYWGPRTKCYEDIIVTTTSEIPLEDWTIRDFDIKNVKTTEVRAVRHFHFTAWPDHGVPETTELLISFRHLVREHMNQYSRNSPTVVHCSAGVGRTGTFIAIDRLIFQIERENVVDLYGIVHDLRMHRPLMVQTEDQYVFLNQCALDIIRARTGNNVDLIYQNTAAISIYENVEPKMEYPKKGY